MKILVVDDERAIRSLLTAALSREGWGVETATDGAEGIVKFDSGCFDLVITDIHMPAVDGRGLVHHIRKSKRPQTPTLGMTGSPKDTAEFDFDTVLPKPLRLKTLTSEVRRLTENRRNSECRRFYPAG